MATLAAVDIGSNTIHALVCEESGGHLTDIARYVETPVLGADVDRTGEIGVAGERVLDALRSVVARARQHQPEVLLACATAAVRKARDGEAFIKRASAEIGAPVYLVDGHREAQLAFLGVATRHAAPGDWLMGDMGGGSTELVVARGMSARSWVSLELGSGVLASRHLSDPPSEKERKALAASVLETLGEAPSCAPQKLVWTGGTATALPLLLSLQDPPPCLDVASLQKAQEKLDAGPAAQIAARYQIPLARVAPLRAGAEILFLLLRRYQLEEFHVSQEGLRQGMLLAWLKAPGSWWLSPEGESESQ